MAMALRVCGNTRFRRGFSFCQASGGLTSHGGDQTGHASVWLAVLVAGGLTGQSGGQTGQCGGLTGYYWAVRPATLGTLDFGAEPKIEGVGKWEGSSALGPIIFRASSEKFYSFEIFRKFRISREEILAKSQEAVWPVIRWRSDWLEVSAWPIVVRFVVLRCGDVFLLGQVHVHQCLCVAWCMFWLTWVKLWRTCSRNRFLCLLVCRLLGGQWRSTARMIGTRLGEPRSRTIEDAGWGQRTQSGV